MSDSDVCARRDSSLNELLREPIVTMLMSSDGVRSDEIRALFRRVAEQDRVRGRSKGRDLDSLERCFTP